MYNELAALRLRPFQLDRDESILKALASGGVEAKGNLKQAVEEEEDYESLPADTSHFIHLLAGGLAGMTEHCAMYPFDAIKVNIKTMMH